MLVCKSFGYILPIAARLSGSCHPSELNTLGQAYPNHPQTLFIAKRAYLLRGRTQKAASPATSASMGGVFFLDEFAIRQWDDPDYSGTSIEGNKQEFVNEVHRQHRHARTISVSMMLTAIEHVRIHTCSTRIVSYASLCEVIATAGFQACGWLRPIL